MKKQKSIVYVAVLSLFLFSGATTFMNAAMQTMIEAHPDLSATTIRTIGTLPSVVSTVVMILVGMAVGKLFSYRFAAIAGSLLIFVGGTLPAIIDSSWTMVLAFMSVLGVGVGFIGIRNTIITQLIPKEQQANFMGYGMVVMSAGAGIAGPVVGYLAKKSWNDAFWFNALAVIPLLIVIFFLPSIQMEQPRDSDTAQEQAVSAEKGKTDWRIYFYPVFQFLNVLALYPLLSGISTFLVEKGLGDSVIAGTVLLVYTITGGIVGFVVGPMQKLFGKRTLGITTLLAAAGVIAIVFAPNLALVYVGTAVCGFFFNASPSILQFYNGQAAPAGKSAFFSVLIVAAMQLGIFASNYYINACHQIFQRSNDVESALFGCIIIYVILGIFSLVVRVAPKGECV